MGRQKPVEEAHGSLFGGLPVGSHDTLRGHSQHSRRRLTGDTPEAHRDWHVVNGS